MRWLDELRRKMKEVPAKYLIHDRAVNTGERVIGKLPEDLLRLWGLHLQMADEILDSMKRHMLCHLENSTDEKECLQFHKNFAWVVEQHAAIVKFFWVAVRSEFDILGDNVGIRAHGKVVVYNDPSDENLDDETLRAVLRQMQCSGRPN